MTCLALLFAISACAGVRPAGGAVIPDEMRRCVAGPEAWRSSPDDQRGQRAAMPPVDIAALDAKLTELFGRLNEPGAPGSAVIVLWHGQVVAQRHYHGREGHFPFGHSVEIIQGAQVIRHEGVLPGACT